MRRVRLTMVLVVVCAAVSCTSAAVELRSPKDGVVVPLLNPAQKHYLSLPRAEREKFFSDDPAVKRAELSGPFKSYGTKPCPVSLEWIPAAEDSAGVTVTVVRKPDGKVFFSKTIVNTNGVAHGSGTLLRQ